MKKNIDSGQFINQIRELRDKEREINQKAHDAVIELLKNNSKGRYIMIPTEDDSDLILDFYYGDEINDIDALTIRGIGLNDKDHICIKAIPYASRFSKDWVDITEISLSDEFPYPEIYQFAAYNIDYAASKENADKIKLDEYDEDD